MDIIDECHICLEELVGELCVLSCGHHFHYKCVKEWMEQNKNLKKPCCICQNETEINNIYYSMSGPNDEMKIETEINNQISNNLVDLYQNNNQNMINNQNNNRNNQINVIEEEFKFGCCNIL